MDQARQGPRLCGAPAARPGWRSFPGVAHLSQRAAGGRQAPPGGACWFLKPLCRGSCRGHRPVGPEAGGPGAPWWGTGGPVCGPPTSLGDQGAGDPGPPRATASGQGKAIPRFVHGVRIKCEVGGRQDVEVRGAAHTHQRGAEGGAVSTQATASRGTVRPWRAAWARPAAGPRPTVLLFVVSCFLASFWALVSDSEVPASQEPVSPGGSPGQSLLLHRRLASPGNSRRQWIVRLCSYVPDAYPRHSLRSRGSQGARPGLVFANHFPYCATHAYAGQEYWQQLTTPLRRGGGSGRGNMHRRTPSAQGAAGDLLGVPGPVDGRGVAGADPAVQGGCTPRMDWASSRGPQVAAQPGPPMAHVPRSRTEISGPLGPRFRRFRQVRQRWERSRKPLRPNQRPQCASLCMVARAGEPSHLLW